MADRPNRNSLPSVIPVCRLWLVGAVLVAVAILGFLWLCASVDSYDQRYSDCMQAKGAFSFPTDAYDQASQECEDNAGPPPTDAGQHPHPWNEQQ